MAHKVVLASFSPYLNAILMRLRNSHQQAVIFLFNINISNLTKLVTFMYCGKVDVEESQLESFLQSAAELQVKGLVATGTNSLKSDASSAPKGVKHAKSASKGINVTKEISSGTSKCGDTLKGVAKSVGISEKSFSKERGTSLVFSSQSSSLVQEHERAFPSKMPSQGEEKGAIMKVELEKVVEDKDADEIGNEVKFSIGAQYRCCRNC